MTQIEHAPLPTVRRGLAIHLDSLRADLEQQRRFRVEQIRQLGATSVGLGWINEPREQVIFALRAAAISVLADIEAALGRMDRGTYGQCQGCHTDIPLEQLQVLPMVKRCMRCQRLHQAGRAANWMGTMGGESTEPWATMSNRKMS
jgi:DnaK suppressor protein